jgi:uncharacterized protein (TIRG00374 family)
VFAVIAARGVHPAEVMHAVGRGHSVWLLPAVATLAVALVMRSERWRSLFAAETRPPAWAALDALLIGYLFNSILPGRVGEVARIVSLNRRTGTSKAEAASTVVLERVFDVMALLVLLVVGLPWLPHPRSIEIAAVAAAVLAVGLGGMLAAIALWGERPLRWVLRPAGRLPHVSEDVLDTVADRLLRGLAALRDRRLATVAMSWTVISWLVLAVSAWCVTSEFGLHVPVGTGLLLVVATGLSAVIPAGPAGLGVFEAAAVIPLRAQGVGAPEALSCALVLHAVNLVPYLVVGPIALRLNERAAARGT